VATFVLGGSLRALQSVRAVGPQGEPVVYALASHGQSLLPVAEAIRRWGGAHQEVHARSGRPDVATDARAIRGAGIAAL
jgi:DNA-binding HxlR family transcriptional regulator